jgi:hypothetical protein
MLVSSEARVALCVKGEVDYILMFFEHNQELVATHHSLGLILDDAGKIEQNKSLTIFYHQ